LEQPRLDGRPSRSSEGFGLKPPLTRGRARRRRIRSALQAKVAQGSGHRTEYDGVRSAGARTARSASWRRSRRGVPEFGESDAAAIDGDPTAMDTDPQILEAQPAPLGAEAVEGEPAAMDAEAGAFEDQPAAMNGDLGAVEAEGEAVEGEEEEELLETYGE
jgi:hypothetical protein